MLPTTWLGGGPCDSRAQMTAGADGGQLRSGGVDHETQASSEKTERSRIAGRRELVVEKCEAAAATGWGPMRPRQVT